MTHLFFDYGVLEGSCGLLQTLNGFDLFFLVISLMTLIMVVRAISGVSLVVP
jgi:hypothetical protein